MRPSALIKPNFLRSRLQTVHIICLQTIKTMCIVTNVISSPTNPLRKRRIETSHVDTQNNTVCVSDADNNREDEEEQQRPSKRVRFSPKARVRPFKSTTSTQVKDTLYYSKSDYRGFMAEACEVVKRGADSKYMELLDCTQLSIDCITDTGAADDNDNVEPSSPSSSSDLTNQYAEQLAYHTFDTSQESMRGLEMLLSPDLIGITRQERKKDIVQAVLSAQDFLMKVERDSPKLISDEQRTKFLQEVSKSYSDPASKFASALGVTDAVVALLEYTN